MADSSEPAFLFLYRKGAVAPVDYLSTFATAPIFLRLNGWERRVVERRTCFARMRWLARRGVFFMI